ncbi:hypothetical protein PYCC9005_002021 [Savitreella phatthalungensis]
MTDTQDISGAFPPPPSHYTLFTSANVAAHKAGELDETTAAYFHPPQIPKESYTLFGQTWPVVDRIASLQESGIEQLFDDRVDVAENAKSLARSLLLKFLDIVQTMARSSSKSACSFSTSTTSSTTTDQHRRGKS